jgi:acyl carrier protein
MDKIMDKNELISKLEEILDLDKNTLNFDSDLSLIQSWDSMSKLSLIVFLDDNFSLKISSKDINNFRLVKDILDFVKIS